MLEVRDLRKHFSDGRGGEVKALDGLSFSAAAGEALGVLGMNGAGKSTCLKILATLLRPDAGTVLLDGVDLLAKPEETRRLVGYLSCSTGLHRRLTPRETLEFFAGLYGLEEGEAKRRADELIARLGMGDFIDRPCGGLSTGQKQKVGIARALIHRPRLLILDEATSGLDVVARQSLLHLVAGLREEGRVMLYCSHHLEEIEAICPRLMIIHQGRSLGCGTAAEVLAENQADSLPTLFSRLAGSQA